MYRRCKVFGTADSTLEVKPFLSFCSATFLLSLSPFKSSCPLMLTYCLLCSQESKSGRPSMPRCRNSVATTTSDDQPHIGNYRLLKTIGKGNFAKVKLARHVLTGKEVGMHAHTLDWTESFHLSLGSAYRVALTF